MLTDHFDGRFMSIGQPKEALLYPNGTAEYPVRYSNNLSPSRKPGLNNSPYGNAPQRSKWNLGSLQLPDGTRVRTRLSRKVRKKLEKFLWLYTQCPVIYRWKDLGSRYWPRWIKQGRCHANQSCSFPPGMTCRASEEREVVILRWHCQYWDPPRFCKWIPLHYPIVRQCSCGCSAVSKTVNWKNNIFFLLFFCLHSFLPPQKKINKPVLFGNKKKYSSDNNFYNDWHSSNDSPRVFVCVYSRDFSFFKNILPSFF